MTETDLKAERLAGIAREAGVEGVLLATQRNFAWLTGGASNRIDGSREAGAGTLLVAAAGRRFAIASAIEMPRLVDEALAGLGFEPLEFAWTAEHGDPSTPVAIARSVLGRNAPLGADWPLPETAALESPIARARAPFVPEEVDRYRELGRDTGGVLGDFCRALRPGQSEMEVADDLAAALSRIGARAIVSLVGADERIARYRHPVPTARRWERLVLVAVCAERQGQVVALSRLVSAEPVSSGLAARTRATASVFGRILASTRARTTGAALFGAAVEAYANAGFPGEELRHHQGGAIGYRSREWLAHPWSADTVRTPQAFAWNPSITGTKVEETALVTDQGVELVTSSPQWPSMEVYVGDEPIAVPDILVLS